MRKLALGAVALALVAGACTTTSGPSRGGAGPGRSGGAGPGRSGGAGAGGSSKPRPAAAYDDGGVLGSMAKAFLKGAPARRLVVEVDWVQGREPAQAALDHLAGVLHEVADKPGGISIERGNAIPASKDSYSIGDIRAIERANRASHSAGDRATMWVVYLNGSYSQGGALGVSYDASSAAIFRDQIDTETTALVNEPAIEKAVLTHEVGHLLSLINLGYHSPRDHEDPDHPHHSKNQDSVMYWAVDDLRLKNILTGGPPDEFDSDDRADLAMVKGS